MKDIRNANKKSKLVFDAKVARSLCKQGFHIIDIKPLRDNPEKTVFVFENTEDFQAAFAQMMDEIKVKKDEEQEVETIDLD